MSNYHVPDPLGRPPVYVPVAVNQKTRGQNLILSPFGLQASRLARMSEALLDAIEIHPTGTATAAIIWLHGLGADGHDFAPLVPELGVVDALGVRVVLPHAPSLPVTINGGMVMPAWYDIRSPDFGQAEDADGIHASMRRLETLIERETARGISTDRIVLAGFSQGGAIVLHTGLRHAERLGGILALSTYLPLAESLPDERSAANADIPIMQAHGQQDPLHHNLDRRC